MGFIFQNKYAMRILVFLLFSAIFLGKLQAQENLRFGFQVSPSFSRMHTTDPGIHPAGTNLGLKMGILGEYYFRENYALSGGIGFFFNTGGTLLYDKSGTYWPGTGLDTLPAQVRLKYNLQYLEIPFGLKMRTREFGYLRYFLEPGISLAIRTRANGHISGPGLSNQDNAINISNELNALLLTVGIGGGVEYSINDSLSLIGGLFFRSGFTDITKDTGTVLQTGQNPRKEDSKGSTNSITIRVGILF